MQDKTVTILLRIRVRGHFAMSNTNYHESHYVTVLDYSQLNRFHWLSANNKLLAMKKLQNEFIWEIKVKQKMV